MKRSGAGIDAEKFLAGAMTGLGIDYTRQVPMGRTIFATKRRVDFVIHNLRAYPLGLAVESKWQTTRGTIEQKFPYVWESIKTYPIPAVVVVHGGGCLPGAIAWLRARCDGQHFVGVFTLEEFVSWVMHSEKAHTSPLIAVE